MLDGAICSTPSDRDCWLTNGTKRYDINTDYEAEWPIGVTRKYTLNVTDMSLAPDGYNNTGGKVFNSTYPGPWIRACWGDDIEVTVTNYLKYNGSESFLGLVPVPQRVMDRFSKPMSWFTSDTWFPCHKS